MGSWLAGVTVGSSGGGFAPIEVVPMHWSDLGAQRFNMSQPLRSVCGLGGQPRKGRTEDELESRRVSGAADASKN